MQWTLSDCIIHFLRHDLFAGIASFASRLYQGALQITITISGYFPKHKRNDGNKNVIITEFFSKKRSRAINPCRKM
jgi:hypothetical protein